MRIARLPNIDEVKRPINEYHLVFVPALPYLIHSPAFGLFFDMKGIPLNQSVTFNEYDKLF